MQKITEEGVHQFFNELVSSLILRRFCIIRSSANTLLSDSIELHNPRMPDQVAGDCIRIGFFKDSLVIGIVLDMTRRDTQKRIENLCNRRFFEYKDDLPGMVCRIIDVKTNDPSTLANELHTAFHGV
jgi:hypothetical protein